MIVRARPRPETLSEAVEILAPLAAGDVRLRAEESEAIALVLAQLRPASKRWVTPEDE